MPQNIENLDPVSNPEMDRRQQAHLPPVEKHKGTVNYQFV